jgi:predicted dehydrogenase
MNKPRVLSRRTVLGASLLAAWPKSAVYALAPARVLGANDRINVGHIGLGRPATGRGFRHLELLKSQAQELNVRTTALCDVYSGNLDDARKVVPLSDSQAHRDYRRLLDDRDVDAVWICTPAHLHAVMAVSAMQAHKEVYLESPLARTVEEALAVHDAQRKTNRTVQVGAQSCSDPAWLRAAELVATGKVGKVLLGTGGMGRSAAPGAWNRDIPAGAGPERIDWSAFLGAAPKRAFDPERFFRWQKYWDYSAGIVSELLPLPLAALVKAAGMAWPTRVVSTGGQYLQHDRDVPDTVALSIDFIGESGPYTIQLAGSTVTEQAPPTALHGSKATLSLTRGELRLQPESGIADAQELRESFTASADLLHQRNFIECIRTRKPPNCDTALALRVQVALSLAERAFRENRCLLYDPETRKATPA